MPEMRRVVKLTCADRDTAYRHLERYVGQVGEVVARYRAVPPYPTTVKLRMADGSERSFLEDAETEVVADA